MSSLTHYELAALALDSYQRGYWAGMPDPDNEDDGLGSTPGTQVAGGTLIANSSLLGEGIDIAADFYAVAYLINGEIVISYRGSDHLAWSTGVGVDVPLAGADGQDVRELAEGQFIDQAQLALDFYNHVKSLYPSSPVTLTGHSLGGALAGYVGYLKNVPSVVFDNTAFIHAAVNTAIEVSTSSSMASLVFGDIDEADRWDVFGQASLEQVALEGDIAGIFRLSNADVDNVDMGTALDPVSAHIQGLLVLALYARSLYGASGAWLSAANAVFTQLSSETIAAAAGIAGSNGNPASGVMKDMIASTVLPGTDNPFGNQGASSLVDDMQDLGHAMVDIAEFSDFVDTAVMFSALQAKHGIAAASLGGVLAFDTQNLSITVDRRDDKWLFGGTQYGFSGDELDFSTLLLDDELKQDERAFLAFGPGKRDYVVQGLSPSSLTWTVGVQSSSNTVEVRSHATNDNIIGTDGNERFLLADGDDIVRPNGGVNWIDGGLNTDTLIDDFAWAEFQIDFDAVNQTYFLALRGSGTEPRIHIVEGVERFVLGGHEFNATNILNTAPESIAIEAMGDDVEEHGLRRGTYIAGAVIGDLRAIDANAHDRFTWEILGNGSQFYSIDQDGVIRTNSAVTYDYDYWRQQVGADASFADWKAESFSAGYQGLHNSKYAITVKVTDAGGASRTGVLYLYLEDGEDALFGTPLNDVLQGGSGRTVIAGLAGADQISDNDWLVADYSQSDASVTIGVTNFRGLIISGSMSGFGGHAEGDTIKLDRNARLDIIGSDFADNLSGTSPGSWNYGHMLNGANEIWGGGGNDTINGGDGTNWLHGESDDDTITGGSGTDWIYGGDGYDTIDAGSGTNYVDFGTGGGVLKLSGGEHYANLETGEFRFKNGAAGQVTNVVGSFGKLYGSSGSDEIHGSSNGDVIYSGGGIDTIYGGAGADRIEGYGNLFGGSGTDTIVFTGTDGYGMYEARGGDERDEISSTAKWVSLFGEQGNDKLTSLASRVWLHGGEGADELIGNTGSSTWNWVSYQWAQSGVGVNYNGSTGSGYLGDALGDTITGNFSFLGSAHADEFNITLRGGYGVELLAGAGNDTINVTFTGNSASVYGDGLHEVDGASYDDTITNLSNYGTVHGGRGNDVLSGGGTLYGDDGADTITTAAGDQWVYLGVDDDVDTFVFSRLAGWDQVFDFSSVDVIRIGSGYKYDDFGDILQNSNQNGSDVDIWFESNSRVTLRNYQLSDLTSDNFLFA